MKRLYILLAVIVLLMCTACNSASTVTPTTASTPPSTTDSTQGDTFIVATETETDSSTEPTEKEERVTISENATVERNDPTTVSGTSSAVRPTQVPTSAPCVATQTNKTWHNAIYKKVNHPAVTKQVWIVDKEAHTKEEPVYGEIIKTFCDTCNADITDKLTEHQHSEPFTYHEESVYDVIDIKLVEVPEQGHYETVIVKEAWTERVLIREAGYY